MSGCWDEAGCVGQRQEINWREVLGVVLWSAAAAAGPGQALSDRGENLVIFL